MIDSVWSLDINFQIIIARLDAPRHVVTPCAECQIAQGPSSWRIFLAAP